MWTSICFACHILINYIYLSKFNPAGFLPVYFWFSYFSWQLVAERWQVFGVHCNFSGGGSPVASASLASIEAVSKPCAVASSLALVKTPISAMADS